jgi:hypothetical protein
MATETQIAFKGTDTQKELAQAAFEAMKRKGFLFGANAPIRMGLDAIVTALTKAGGPMAGQPPAKLKPDLEAALGLNPEVFAREGDEYITCKSGHAPAGAGGDNAHTFKDRLNIQAHQLDAEEAAQYRASIIDLSATRDEKIFASEDMEEEEAPPQPHHHHVPRSHHPMPELRSIAASIIPAEEIPPEWLPPVPEPELEVELELEPEVEPQPAEALAPAPAPATTRRPAVEAAAPTTPPAPAPTKRDEETPAVPAPIPSAAQTAAEPRVAPVPSEAAPEPAQAQPAVPVVQPSARSDAVEAPAQPVAPVAQQEPVQTVTPVTPEAPTPTAVPAAEGVQTQPQPQAPAVRAPETAGAPPVKRPAPPAPPPAPVMTGPVEVAIPAEAGPITIDLRDPIDEILLDDDLANALTIMIGQAVENDIRIVSFGSEIFPDEAVERFSKGDYRRIKEYLDEPETGGLASDRDIMADVFNRRTDYPDYERLRFSVNYRMLKEKKDFEFVGVDSDRLWVTAGSSPATPPIRKPAEVGQDYRFLEDPANEEESVEATGGPVQYSLTYYEYEQGVLPYDARFKRIFPGALFEDQRASLIRFEIPLLYGAIITELRYPTGNRGGFIMGFRDLFAEHMVPGARFTIVPTDRGEDVFEIHFDRAEEREENLLQLDERRGRYVFRPVQFAIETDPDLFLTQDKFGKLHNHKKLEESERKRPETILVNAFEAIGEPNDGKLWAALDDIYAVANIERPISRTWLRQLLSGATYPYFLPDESVEGAYFYDPEKKGS